MTQEALTEKDGGLAFNVIFKEASKTESPILTPRSRARLEGQDIAQKLDQARIRRESMEAEKLTRCCMNRERAQEAIDRMRQADDKIRQTYQERINKKIDTCTGNREQQIAHMREKLRSHLNHVDEVCQRSSVVQSDLQERLNRKYEAACEKRRAQLEANIEKVREHAKHIDEVLKTSENMTKENAEKSFQRMECALKKRNENIQALQEKLQEHASHIKTVQKNKLYVAAGDSMAMNVENGHE